MSPFEANIGYKPRISWDEEIDPKSRSRAIVNNANYLFILIGIYKDTILAV